MFVVVVVVVNVVVVGILTGTRSTRIRWSTSNMSTSGSWMIAMLKRVQELGLDCMGKSPCVQT